MFFAYLASEDNALKGEKNMRCYKSFVKGEFL